MAEVPISNLSELSTPLDGDVYPVVSNNITQKVTYSTLYNSISSKVVVGKYVPVATYNDSQTFLSNASGNWQTAYTTVTANSAAWGSTPVGYSIFREVSSTASPNNTTNVYALSVYSPSTDVDVALLTKGTGATLAQIPDNTATGGAKRGQYATDLQKSRTGATQVASGNYGVIVGGQNNIASGAHSLVVGGSSNTVTELYGVVVGGSLNSSLSEGSVVGGGQSNINSSIYGVIGGGFNNSINSISLYGGVGAGRSNSLSGTYSYIGGGFTNTIQDDDRSIIGGGTNNTIYDGNGRNVICGGGTNSVSGGYVFVGGGYSNTANGEYVSIVGGQNNNTNNKQNAHIIGSNITAPSADFTYVNNLSTTGTVTSDTAVIGSLTATSVTATGTRCTNLTATNTSLTNLTATTTTSTTVSAATYQGIQAIKAWVNFDGTGTTAGDATINASYNVSRVRRTGTGAFTIVFANSSIFANANYIMAGSVASIYNANPIISTGTSGGVPTLKTTLSCSIDVIYGSSTNVIAKEVGLMFIGS